DVFNGNYNSEMEYYSFNISLFLQQLVNGDSDKSSLYLRMTNYGISPNRVALKANEAKLKFTYTSH
ncbi:MAG: hypothetical protein U9R54_05600, partial [Bacteroidota bacterium]|nr:hypothetical protein [Bacteroidota bacterium]